MSKLCQCKQDYFKKMLALVTSVAAKLAPIRRHDYLSISTKELIASLESDCVCEKKETVTKSDQLKGTSHGVVRDEKGEIIAQCRCPSHEKEKQSQPPCEKWNHSFIENKLEGRTPSLQKLPSGEYMYVKRQITLWTCRECGLVTCVDPSRSAPSKNPNN